MSELISGYLANAVEAINEEFGEGYAKAVMEVGNG